MPAPTTLLELAESEVGRYETLLDDAREELRTAQEDRRTLREERRQRTEEMEESVRAARGVRERLGAVDTPADGETLLDDLEEALMAGRAALARLHELDLELLDASVRAELAATRIRRSEARLADARARAAAAGKEERLRSEDWAPRLSSPPLSDLPTRADDLRSDASWQDLEQALDDAIPEGLRSSARKRLELEWVRRANARERAAFAGGLLDEHLEESGDLGGSFRPEEAAYLEARSALETFVLRAAEELRSAQDLVGREPPDISEGEAERLAELDSDGSTAAGLEEAVTDQRIEVEARRLDLVKARLQAVADPEADPDVVSDAESALQSAEDDLATALSAFDTDGHPETLERWQLAVPDDMWRFYLRFLEAERRLDRFADEVDPSTLQSDLAAAEEALAGARAEAADARVRRDGLEDGRREEEARLRGLEQTAGQRRLASVRGDG